MSKKTEEGRSLVRGGAAGAGDSCGVIILAVGGVVTVCVVLRLPLTSASDGNLLPAPKILARFAPQIPPSTSTLVKQDEVPRVT